MTATVINLRAIQEFDGKEPPSGGGSGGGGYNDDMEARVKALEDSLATVRTDLALIKATHATKEDIQGAKRDIAEAKNSIIMWVVSAIFLAQLLPTLPRIIEAVSRMTK